MKTRDDAALAFAAAMGWADVEGRPLLVVAATEERCAYYPLAEPGASIPFRAPPPADAPMAVHLAFVGRVAEAVGTLQSVARAPAQRGWRVGMKPVYQEQGEWGGFPFYATASDPAWAAMLAGTLAVEARRRTDIKAARRATRAGAAATAAREAAPGSPGAAGAKDGS